MLLSFNHPQNPSHGKGGIEPVLASCANHLEESCRINETIEKRALNESADQIRVLWAYNKGRCLGDAWLISSVIDIVQAEAAAVAIGPLKVVKKRPHKISCEKGRGEELGVHDQTQQHRAHKLWRHGNFWMVQIESTFEVGALVQGGFHRRHVIMQILNSGDKSARMSMKNIEWKNKSNVTHLK